MKKSELHINDIIIIKSNGEPLRFNDGSIVIYGSFEDAREDVLAGDKCIRVIESSKKIQNELNIQINK